MKTKSVFQFTNVNFPTLWRNSESKSYSLETTSIFTYLKTRTLPPLGTVVSRNFEITLVTKHNGRYIYVWYVRIEHFRVKEKKKGTWSTAQSDKFIKLFAAKGKEESHRFTLGVLFELSQTPFRNSVNL